MAYQDLVEEVQRMFSSVAADDGGGCEVECGEPCLCGDAVLGDEDNEGEVLSVDKDDPDYCVQRRRLEEEDIAEIEEQLLNLKDDNPRFCGLVRMMMEGYRNSIVQVDATSGPQFQLDDAELDPSEVLFDEIREAMEEQVDKVGSNEGLRLLQEAYGNGTPYRTKKCGKPVWPDSAA